MRRVLPVVLLIAVMALGAVGCNQGQDSDDTTSGGEAVSSVATSTADGTTDGSADDGATTDGTSSGSSTGDSATDDGTTADGTTADGDSISSVDVSSVLSELDAVRRELDAISLPDDTDFADIEAALNE